MKKAGQEISLDHDACDFYYTDRIFSEPPPILRQSDEIRTSI